MVDIWVDDFESATGATTQIGVTRTASNHTDTANGTVDTVAPADDYSVRTDGTTPAGLDFAFTGFTGSYWRAEDLDGLDNGFTGADTDVITWTGVDISGRTGLGFEGLFAADNFFDSGLSYRFEVDDFLRVEVQIDGGGYVNILEFRGDNASGGVNGNFSIDTNADGVGDGTTLGHAAQLISATIAGTGSTLDLRVTFSLDGSNEEIGFDNLKITGDAAEINGTPGNDTLIGTANADTINGLAGNDRLLGDAGDDVLNGGSGNDQLWGQGGADAMDGGTGTDSAYYLLATAGVSLNLATGGTGGEAAGDTYTSIEQFFGSNFNDVLVGFSANDRLFGLGGNDTLDGNAGNDLLSAGEGNDNVLGGAGNDLLFGGNGDDTLQGGGDNDRLFGDAGADDLFGGDGNDLLVGGAGADDLDGGAGVDTASYATAGAGVNLNLAGSGSAGDAAGDSYTGVENVLGSQFADDIGGDGGNNILNGLGGNDLLQGEDGNDILIGGAGNDQLAGGNGRDFLTGGSGNDIFSFAGIDQGVNIIRDFEDGADTISLFFFGGVDNFNDLSLTQVGTSVHIREDAGQTGVNNGTLLVLTNTTVASLSSADFDIIGAVGQEMLEDKGDIPVAELPSDLDNEALDSDMLTEALMSMAEPAPHFEYTDKEGILQIMTVDDAGYWDMAG